MLSVLANIVIGLVTSLLGGGLVWLWERGKRTRRLHRKAGFFGVVPGETCLIVLGSKHHEPGSAHPRDVRSVVELAMLAGELGCQVTVMSSDFRGSNGDRTEFCVGGPLGDANVRSGGHLATYLPGVTIHPYSDRPDSVAYSVGGEQYLFDRGNEEYALVAKFTPAESSRPVILVCGQSSVANQGAIHFLRRAYAEAAAAVESTERYCLVIKVSGIHTYEFHRAELERDVSAAAFARRG
ncbi:hypothetical protein HUT19_21380 [Streptomyces sp. NA02950]|uniref:hypothetical protein n=1 Tax=Streptomyces sp. NA02950 TaxID=2742137 RepID=UPI001592835D|nr:hypothetical protein [Streptomyces sp. NA02950]QKV93992.1 hypothetical protein HUT19_21380 [Streptomyces sp. NA02950]